MMRERGVLVPVRRGHLHSGRIQTERLAELWGKDVDVSRFWTKAEG